MCAKTNQTRLESFILNFRKNYLTKVIRPLIFTPPYETFYIEHKTHSHTELRIPPHKSFPLTPSAFVSQRCAHHGLQDRFEVGFGPNHSHYSSPRGYSRGGGPVEDVLEFDAAAAVYLCNPPLAHSVSDPRCLVLLTQLHTDFNEFPNDVAHLPTYCS